MGDKARDFLIQASIQSKKIDYAVGEIVEGIAKQCSLLGTLCPEALLDLIEQLKDQEASIMQQLSEIDAEDFE